MCWAVWKIDVERSGSTAGFGIFENVCGEYQYSKCKCKFTLHINFV